MECRPNFSQLWPDIIEAAQVWPRCGRPRSNSIKVGPNGAASSSPSARRRENSSLGLVLCLSLSLMRKVRPTSANLASTAFRPNSARFGPGCLHLARFRPTSTNTLPGIGRYFLEIDPDGTGIDQMRLGSDLRTEFGQFRLEFGQHLPRVDQFLLSLARTRPTLAILRPHLARGRPISA